ncbi:MAG: hypothetical protein A2882_04470 [Phenylobacterium sp. RIFCSPHIGHO2_01_FULL_70_10]|nr:MAG: hypothetical protein A2882_04470 [Phenylobacterium sp. RIFCSPHIGHO2_01_FULL_70_10]
MRPFAGAALMLLLAILLIGCEREPTVELTPEEMSHLRLKRLDPEHGRPVRPLISQFGTEEGLGEVVAIDPSRLTVSLRHTHQSRNDWPSMVMNFRVRQSDIARLRPGARVYFRATVQDEAGEILYVAPAPAS